MGNSIRWTTLLSVLPLFQAIPCVAQVRATLSPPLWSFPSGDYPLTVIGHVVTTDTATWAALPRDGAILEIRQGRLEKVIGREGGGPGEFRSVGRIGIVNGVLWAADSRQSRITRFTSQGPATTTFRHQDVLSFVPGSILDTEEFVGFPILSPEDVDLPPVELHAYNEDGAPTRTLAAVRIGRPFLLVPLQGGELFTRDPLNNGDLFEHHPLGDGIYVIRRDRPDAFTAIRIRANGDTVYVEDFAVPPAELSGSVRDSLISSIGPRARRSHATEVALAEAFVNRPIPPVSRAFIGTDGAAWLERNRLVYSNDWVVLGPGGEVRYLVQAPSDFEIRGASGDYVVGVVLDELDVPTLELRRVLIE